MDAAHTAKDQARAIIRVEEMVISSLKIALDAIEEGKALRKALQETTRTLNRYHTDFS